MLLVISFVLAVALFGGVFLHLWRKAIQPQPTIAVIQPPNTTALVVLKPNTVKKDGNGNIVGVNNDSGDVVNVLSTSIGDRLDKDDPNPMNWKLVPGRERRGFLYHLMGMKIIGILRYIRLNEVRTFRWGREHDGDKYHVMPKTEITAFPFVTGQHDIELEGIETKRVVKFNMHFNIATKETYPVRVRLLKADAYAQLTTMVESHVVDKMGKIDPKEFIGEDPDSLATNERKEDIKKDLIKSFKEIRELVEKETGITMGTVSMRSFDFDPETRKALEEKYMAKLDSEKTLIEADAAAKKARIDAAGYKDSEITRAEGDKQAEILRAEGHKTAQLAQNDASEDRLKRVLEPAAANALTSEVFRSDRESAAIENNETLTTLVLGGASSVLVNK
jgi:regulator of protease activity HflC (stomatin/prohibitin superfamily)